MKLRQKGDTYLDGPEPLEPVTVRDYVKDKRTGVVKPVEVARTVARGGHWKVWRSMTHTQERAAMRIAEAFRAVTGECSWVLPRYDERLDKPHDPAIAADRYVDLESDLFDLHPVLERAGLSWAAAMDWIIYEIPLRTIDRKRRRYNGWASENLFGTLDEFARMKKWG